MRRGVNVAKISVVGLILVGLFLAAGIILDVVGQTSQGQQAIATAVGIAVGTGATTVTVIQDVASKFGDKGKPTSS